jgi:sensor domain CHASE-containing protein
MSHAKIALHRSAAGFWGGHQDARVIGSLAALIAAALLMVAAAVYLGSLRQDRLQVASEQRIVALAVENLKKAVATNARDYAWWNEAVEHLTLKLDEAWAEINIGPYVHATFGYEVAVVVASGGRPLIGWLDGVKASDDALAALIPTLADLIAETRRRSGSPPEPAAGIVAEHSSLLVAAASPIVPQPDFQRTVPPGPPALLVFVKRLDQPFLARLGQSFGLEDLTDTASKRSD